MPNVFLSPSTQEQNYYVIGGNEEQYMNQLTDEIIPYLNSSGIRWTRNDPKLPASAAIAQANAGSYNLYVALHSNAAPESAYGTVRGSDVYYYRYGNNSKRAADIFVKNLKLVYPLPDKVRALPTTALGEVSRSRAPAVLLEIAYHDNIEDATWIKENIPSIAWAVAKGITQYFGLPLCEPMAPQPAFVKMSSGTLNLRARPNMQAAVLASIPNGAAVTILGMCGDWDVVQYGSLTGYAAARYLQPKG